MESIITVTIEAAQLEIDIATPHIPPSMPFVTDYVKYRRYETVDAKVVSVADHFNSPTTTIEIESDLYGSYTCPFNLHVGSSAGFHDVWLELALFFK